MGTLPLPRRTRYAERKKGTLRQGNVVDDVELEEDAGETGRYLKLIEQIQTPEGDRRYRFCYYVWDSDIDNWRFGQYALSLWEGDAARLLRKARKKGWPL